MTAVISLNLADFDLMQVTAADSLFNFTYCSQGEVCAGWWGGRKVQEQAPVRSEPTNTAVFHHNDM